MIYVVYLGAIGPYIRSSLDDLTGFAFTSFLSILVSFENIGFLPFY